MTESTFPEATNYALHKFEAMLAGAGSTALSTEDFEALQSSDVQTVLSQLGWEG